MVTHCSRAGAIAAGAAACLPESPLKEGVPGRLTAPGRGSAPVPTVRPLPTEFLPRAAAAPVTVLLPAPPVVVVTTPIVLSESCDGLLTFTLTLTDTVEPSVGCEPRCLEKR